MFYAVPVFGEDHPFVVNLRYVVAAEVVDAGDEEHPWAKIVFFFSNGKQRLVSVPMEKVDDILKGIAKHAV